MGLLKGRLATVILSSPSHFAGFEIGVNLGLILLVGHARRRARYHHLVMLII